MIEYSAITLLPSEYDLNYDFEFAKAQVAALDKLRTERALAGMSGEFQQVFQLLAALLHYNHPRLPGYVPDAPAGICYFQLSDIQQAYLKRDYPDLDFLHINAVSQHTFDAINGVYVMGSVASVCQTSYSDLDIWVCHREDLNRDERDKLLQKSFALQAWAKKLDIEINLFLMDQERFRSFRYAEALTSDNCGSAQYMLLLDEFYRSAIRLAGKPLLWLHLQVNHEADYEHEVECLIRQHKINPQEWVDFGGLGAFSANEYFGASLWQLYKGIDSPYKSTIKILLLESYSWEYPHTKLIARDFKRRLLQGKINEHHFDPYLAMLERVTAYLEKLKDFKRLDFVRCCFYAKTTEDLWHNQHENWRLDTLYKLVADWGWTQKRLDELNQRPFWKIKKVKESYENLVHVLMLSYRSLVNFARKYKVDASIMPQDVSILSRKLYTAFEELPGKVTLLNPQISTDLSEPHLIFIEAANSRAVRAGWYVINQSPDFLAFSRQRYIEYNPNLNKLVAWAYFNGLLTADTQLHIFSRNVNLETLREFVTDLRLCFPVHVSPPTNEELHHPCEIRQLMVAVNLSSDPTQKLTQARHNIKQSDLFNFGPNEENMVGSIDLIYRNLWNEIRTLHFEGTNAILLALKVLSNKIYRGSGSPQSVNVTCYSRHYQKAICHTVSVLVNRCINIQVGASLPSQTNNLLRVAGKNWKFFFEERGISLQEIAEPISLQSGNLAAELQAEVVEKEPQFSEHNVTQSRGYPKEMDAFASEGFLQFFFEDNADGSFNVYLLDESNRIEIYRHCDGKKEQKIREINHIYNASDQDNNPYKITRRDFNYPQFYQLLPQSEGVKIVPFHSRQQMV